VLAELGDKTMLATITLAADNDWLGVWIGSTLGMVVADGLAIVVGAVAGKHLPERLIQITAAALFLIFGAYMLLENIFPAAPGAIIVGGAIAIVLIFAAVLRAMPERLRPAVLRTEDTSPTVLAQPGREEVPEREIAEQPTQQRERK
jgi:hypothetical protein